MSVPSTGSRPRSLQRPRPLQVTLEEEQLEFLRGQARQMSRSMSGIVRQLIERERQAVVEKPAPPTVRVLADERDAPDRLFWTVGEIVEVDPAHDVVRLDLGSLLFNEPVYARLTDLPAEVARPGQCFEARATLRSRTPEELCLLEVRPLGRPEDTLEDLLDRFEARLRPVQDVIV